MNPTVPYLLHALRNALKAGNDKAALILMDEITAALAPAPAPAELFRLGSPLNPYILN